MGKGIALALILFSCVGCSVVDGFIVSSVYPF